MISIYKVLVLGDPAVGKSCLLTQFCERKFQISHLSTVGIDFKMKKMEIDGIDVKLQIWDTAGQERFQTITKTLYKGVSGVFVVFALNNKKSFESVNQWVKQIEDNSGGNVQVVLIGNKSDIPRSNHQISVEEIKQFAEERNITYFPTSAMTGDNVEAAFEDIARKMINNNLQAKPIGLLLTDDKTLHQEEEKDKKNGCC